MSGWEKFLSPPPWVEAVKAGLSAALGVMFFCCPEVVKGLLELLCFLVLGAAAAACIAGMLGSVGKLKRRLCAAGAALTVGGGAVLKFVYPAETASWTVGVIAVLCGASMLTGGMALRRRADWTQRGILLGGGILSLLPGILFLVRRADGFFRNAPFFGAYFTALALLITASTDWRKRKE